MIDYKLTLQFGTWVQALDAGIKAGEQHTPTPMVVAQHSDPFDDSSPIQQQWHVPQGVCGFAWLTFRANTPENRTFLKVIKHFSELLPHNDITRWKSNTFEPGYRFWISEFGQSYEKKRAMARAIAQHLNDELGITIWAESRLD